MNVPYYSYSFLPNVYKEFQGKKFFYCGKFKKNKQLIYDLRRILTKNGFNVKIQSTENNFILWSRKK